MQPLKPRDPNVTTQELTLRVGPMGDAPVSVTTRTNQDQGRLSFYFMGTYTISQCVHSHSKPVVV